MAVKYKSVLKPRKDTSLLLLFSSSFLLLFSLPVFFSNFATEQLEICQGTMAKKKKKKKKRNTIIGLSYHIQYYEKFYVFASSGISE
jgi:hypothetical protein